MKHLWLALMVMTVLCACGGRSHGDLSHKLDSIARLENKERLRLQGIMVDEDNRDPFEIFFDSLNVQPLPLTCSDTYVTYTPNFTPMADAMLVYLGIDDVHDARVIALPENSNVRVMLISGKPSQEGPITMWLYTLGLDYKVVDRLRLHVAKTGEGDDQATFYITSDFTIELEDIDKITGRFKRDVYYIDIDGKIIKSEAKTNQN